MADGIRARGGTAAASACDVTDEDDRDRVVDLALSSFAAPTILVNNAGGGGPQPFDMPMEKFVWAYELNVFSGFRLCQLCVPHMAGAGRGAVVNISSMAGENRNAHMTSYSSSKAAVNHLTRNMAFDVGPMGIRVNAIAPGAIRTDALAGVLTPEIERQMLRHTPLGRLGEAQDIANVALFLVSPLSSWVSGQVITVSGGGSQELEWRSSEACSLRCAVSGSRHSLRGPAPSAMMLPIISLTCWRTSPMSQSSMANASTTQSSATAQPMPSAVRTATIRRGSWSVRRGNGYRPLSSSSRVLVTLACERSSPSDDAVSPSIAARATASK